MDEIDLRTLADRISVEDLLTRYATAVDQRDWDLYRTVFTPTAEVDYTSAGGIAGPLDEVVEFLAASLPMFEMTQHVIGNVDLAVDPNDPDRATVSAAFTNPMRLPGGDVWFTGGWYHHDLVRTPDGWRSQRLREEAAWFDRAPF
ncbi:MAG: nuclear transport factor 2 family protein [Actinomycetota bacterium]|nr:nuclear transport factor 2 family protein [Actinomycetota bacterium]MEC9467744.1 nuclear transport factor 2 family protein [Actinomycetota bacterium]